MGKRAIELTQLGQVSPRSHDKKTLVRYLLRFFKVGEGDEQLFVQVLLTEKLDGLLVDLASLENNRKFFVEQP